MGIFGDGVKVGKFINALSNWDDETRKQDWKRIEPHGQWFSFYICNYHPSYNLSWHAHSVQPGKIIFDCPSPIPRNRTGGFTVGVRSSGANVKGNAEFRIEDGNGTKLMMKIEFNRDEDSVKINGIAMPTSSGTKAKLVSSDGVYIWGMKDNRNCYSIDVFGSDPPPTLCGKCADMDHTTATHYTYWGCEKCGEKGHPPNECFHNNCSHKRGEKCPKVIEQVGWFEGTTRMIGATWRQLW